MLQYIKKLISKPINSDPIMVEGIQMWGVRWTSRYGEFCTDTKPELEAFPSEESAESYANDLRNAFKLIKHTSKVKVNVILL